VDQPIDGMLPNLAARMLRKFELNQSPAKLRLANATAMYALIIVVGVLAPANSSAIGVTSQTVGKFETWSSVRRRQISRSPAAPLLI